MAPQVIWIYGTKSSEVEEFAFNFMDINKPLDAKSWNFPNQGGNLYYIKDIKTFFFEDYNKACDLTKLIKYGKWPPFNNEEDKIMVERVVITSRKLPSKKLMGDIDFIVDVKDVYELRKK
jgi:hypothetical protein